MAVIYLKHFLHGAKVATLEMEAEYDERNGWVRYNPDTPPEPEQAAPANALETLKRGRPRKVVEPQGV